VKVRRQQVIELLKEALLPLSWVNAAWLGGSDAFGRADELSDVDLQVDVDDGHVAATFGAVEAALAAASPAVRPPPLPQPERAARPPAGPVRPGRGRPAGPLDPAELDATLTAAVAGIRERLPFTLPQAAKEVRRGDVLAALPRPATTSAPATPATTCPPRSRRR
jgi:hypothetical protein